MNIYAAKGLPSGSNCQSRSQGRKQGPCRLQLGFDSVVLDGIASP